MVETNTATGTKSPSGEADIRTELKKDAQDLGDKAKERATEEANARKGDATKTAHSLSSALNKAAGELRNDDDAPSWLTSALETTASEIDTFTRGIEGKDVKEIGRDVAGFARQNPLAFLGASAAAGFAAARLLRAGGEYQSHSGDNPSQSGAQNGSPVLNKTYGQSSGRSAGAIGSGWSQANTGGKTEVGGLE